MHHPNNQNSFLQSKDRLKQALRDALLILLSRSGPIFIVAGYNIATKLAGRTRIEQIIDTQSMERFPALQESEYPRLAFTLAFENEAATLSQDDWNHFWRRVRRARPITAIATIGATVINPLFAPAGGALGWALETYLFDDNNS